MIIAGRPFVGIEGVWNEVRLTSLWPYSIPLASTPLTPES